MSPIRGSQFGIPRHELVPLSTDEPQDPGSPPAHLRVEGVRVKAPVCEFHEVFEGEVFDPESGQHHPTFALQCPICGSTDTEHSEWDDMGGTTGWQTECCTCGYGTHGCDLSAVI